MKLPRHAARVLAFQTLFEMHSHPGQQPDEAIRRRAAAPSEEGENRMPPNALGFAERLLLGTLARRGDIDARISHVASAFPLEQMSLTDRSILELAVYELEFLHDAPVKVVINEAVELAKTYGGESSGRFVNGVLGTIAEDIAGRTVERASGGSPQTP